MTPKSGKSFWGPQEWRFVPAVGEGGATNLRCRTGDNEAEVTGYEYRFKIEPEISGPQP